MFRKGRILRTAVLVCATVLEIGSAASASARDGGDQQAVAAEIVGAFDALFSGPHSGTRAVHAKGLLLEGDFRASPAAAGLSRAVHFQAGDVPVLVRFSDFAGLPTIPDGDDVASPRGMSIKFLLADGGDTDIVAHSYNGFPAATPEDFLEFLRSLAETDPKRLNAYLDSHPAGRAFANAPKPPPLSFATETFYGVNSFRFTNLAGVSRFARYRFEPVAGSAHLTKQDAATRPPNYLADELRSRLTNGPVQFRLVAQLAETSDNVDDGSVAWPDSRPSLEIGIITLRHFSESGDARQRMLLFTPLSLVSGIAPSHDPLLIARTRAYRISFDRRARGALVNAAPQETSP